MVPVTFYNPDGQGGSIRFVAQGVRKEDSVFLNELSVDVSAEVDPDTYEEGWYILYFDYGDELADGTPNEVIILTEGRPAEECFAQAVEEIKARISKEAAWPTTRA